MNYKVTFKGFEFKMKGEGRAKLDEITVEVQDLNLKEIPALIKEGRKFIKDIKTMIEEERFVDAHIEALKEQAQNPFPAFLDEILGSCGEDCDCEGIDTDGDHSEFMQDELDEIFGNQNYSDEESDIDESTQDTQPSMNDTKAAKIRGRAGKDVSSNE